MDKLLNTVLDRFGLIDGGKFYRTTLGGEKKSAVFIVEPLLDILKNTKETTMDGTFQVVPKKPKLRQLFTIMGIYHDCVSIFK